MKKFIAAALLTASLAFIFTSCGTCDLCKKEIEGESYDFEMNDEDVVYCEDCEEKLGWK